MKTTRSMFKGLLGGGILLLVFAFVGQATAQTWIELFPTGGPPAERLTTSAVYAPGTNRLIVFGGIGGAAGAPPFFNDVWVLSNADGTDPSPPAWTQVLPSGTPPSARGWHKAVYDSSSNRMILFAGNPNSGSCIGTANDVWVLSNPDGTDLSPPAWTQVFPSGGPPSERGLHSAVYDPTTNRMMVFGGLGPNVCSTIKNDVWVLENANALDSPAWTQLNPTPDPVNGSPGARFAHSSVYDPTNNRMIVFGGQEDTPQGKSNEVWVLEHANGLGGTPTWTLLNTIGAPGPCALHTAVYDSAANRMIVWGCGQACAPVDPPDGVWVLEHANGLGGTPTWTLLNTTGGPPSARDMHTAVFNPSNNRMTIFAGRNNLPDLKTLNDVWVLTDANGIAVITVAIDIKPRTNPNSINPRSRGVISVAILTTDAFDATNVEPATVRFGANGTEAAPVHSALKDVDGDGDTDLILHFKTQDTGIQCGDTSGSLTGETFTGQAIEGSDSIKTAGCK